MDGPILQLGGRKACSETHIVGSGKRNTGNLLRGVTQGHEPRRLSLYPFLVPVWNLFTDERYTNVVTKETREEQRSTVPYPSQSPEVQLTPTTLPATTAWTTLLMPCLLRGEGLVPEGPETAGFSLQVSMCSTGTPLNW